MSKIVLYATREEWRDLRSRDSKMREARERAREVRNCTVIVKDGRGGIELFRVTNHWSRHVPRT